MIYVLYGENNNQINNFIQTTIKKENIENVVKYSMEETELSDILTDASYIDLFGGKKAIIVDDSSFLSIKGKIETDPLENYINNMNDSCILFFIVRDGKPFERKKVVKLIKEKGSILEFKKLEIKDTYSYIKQFFESDKYKIDSKTINEIVLKTKDMLYALDSELEKLKLYKIDSKTITTEDVKKVISKNLETNIFSLVDAVKNNDKSSMLKIYAELIEQKQEPIKILVLLANQFRLYYIVKVLLSEGLKYNDIVKKLGINPYRVTLAINESQKFKEKKLLSILKELSEIDKKIKLGLTNKETALEMFFLNL